MKSLKNIKMSMKILKTKKVNGSIKYVVLIYLTYSRIQDNLTARRKKVKFINATPECIFKGTGL